MILVHASEKDRLRFQKFIRPEGDCLVWTGALTAHGYGKFRFEGKIRLAHRVAWFLSIGARLDSKTTLDHLCRNRACVNAAHLEPVSLAENILRSPIQPTTINAMKTHCKRGHPFDAANTYVSPGRGHRSCRACSRTASAERYRARRQPAVRS